MKGDIFIWAMYLSVIIVVHILLVSMIADTTGTLPLWIQNYRLPLFVLVEAILVSIGIKISFT